MNKYMFFLILSSIFTYFGALIFTSFRELFFIISFCCIFCFICLLWIKDRNYNYIFLVLFLFKTMLSESYSEGLLIFIIVSLVLGILYKIKNSYFIKDISYKKNLNGVDVLIAIFLVISLFIPNYYYSGCLFFLFFINLSFIYDILLYISWDRLKKNSVKILDGNKFLNLTLVKTVIFNKTGVLTLGKFEIRSVVTKNESDFWTYLSYAEATKSDRIANLIKNSPMFVEVELSKRKRYQEFENGVVYYLNRKKVIVGNSSLLREHGIDIIEKDIGTFIYVALSKKIIGYLEVVDKVKLINKNIISDLKELDSYHLVVFSNDQMQLVNLVARVLGISDSFGELTNLEKSFWLYHLRRQYNGLVLLVSDGSIDLDGDIIINLASFPFNEEVKSDIIILDHDLGKLVLLMRVSKLLKALKTNLFITSILGKFLIILISFLWISDLWLVVCMFLLLSIMEIIIGFKRVKGGII